MKTHFNYVFSQIKRLISDIFAFLVLCTLTHRFLKDVTEATQLAAQLEASLFSYFNHFLTAQGSDLSFFS